MVDLEIIDLLLYGRSFHEPSVVTIEFLHNFLIMIYSFLAEKRLVEEVRKHDTLVVVGETGSGKTTRKSSLCDLLFCNFLLMFTRGKCCLYLFWSCLL